MCDVGLDPVCCELVSERRDNRCDSCETLKLELEKVSAELSPAHTIIKLLQEDDYATRLTSEQSHESKLNHSGILEHINRRENNWIPASSGRRARTKNRMQEFSNRFLQV